MEDVGTLARQLQSGSVAQRAAAAEVLCRLGEGAGAAADAIVRACADDELVSQWAVAALEAMGPPPAASAHALAGLASDADERVAYWAITLLGRLGAAAESLTDVILSALERSPHPSVRQRAAWALGRIGKRSAAVVAALGRSRESQDPRLARLADQALSLLQ